MRIHSEAMKMCLVQEGGDMVRTDVHYDTRVVFTINVGRYCHRPAVRSVPC